MRLKLILVWPLIFLLGVVLAVGVYRTVTDSDDALRGPEKRIVASFYPLAYAAREIAGPDADIVNLTPPGAEPHDLELTPSDVREIGEADLVLLMGRDFQPQLADAAGSRSERVLYLLDAATVFVDGGDPHVWLDPNTFASIVKRIGSALDREPAAQALAVRLRRLDGEFGRGLRGCARREIVTSHDAFAYLAARYNLRQIAITGLSPEAEPSPGRLAEVVDEVKKVGATTVFFEPLVSRRVADTVARETGVKTAELNPIEGLTAEQAVADEDYFSLMRKNLRALRKALGCP